MDASQSPEYSDHRSASRGSVASSGPSDRRLRWGTAVTLTLLLALLATSVLRAAVVDVYTVQQESMVPTLADGERILVDRRLDAEELEVGDVVVFDGTGSFAPYEPSSSAAAELIQRIGHWLGIGAPPQTYVKRVLGVGGDTVACCDEQGRLTIDGEPLDEPYLQTPVSLGDPASELSFEVEVPPGRVWVMGDARADSVDSRHLLGAPGGGMISEDRIIGRATGVFWPWGERRSLQED